MKMDTLATSKSTGALTTVEPLYHNDDTPAMSLRENVMTLRDRIRAAARGEKVEREPKPEPTACDTAEEEDEQEDEEPWWDPRQMCWRKSSKTEKTVSLAVDAFLALRKPKTSSLQHPPLDPLLTSKHDELDSKLSSVEKKLDSLSASLASFDKKFGTVAVATRPASPTSSVSTPSTTPSSRYLTPLSSRATSRDVTPRSSRQSSPAPSRAASPVPIERSFERLPSSSARSKPPEEQTNKALEAIFGFTPESEHPSAQVLPKLHAHIKSRRHSFDDVWGQWMHGYDTAAEERKRSDLRHSLREKEAEFVMSMEVEKERQEFEVKRRQAAKMIPTLPPIPSTPVQSFRPVAPLPGRRAGLV